MMKTPLLRYDTCCFIGQQISFIQSQRGDGLKWSKYHLGAQSYLNMDLLNFPSTVSQSLQKSCMHIKPKAMYASYIHTNLRVVTQEDLQQGWNSTPCNDL